MTKKIVNNQIVDITADEQSVYDALQAEYASGKDARDARDALYATQEYARKRKSEYPPLDDLIVALWENVVEERAASVIELESKRQVIKGKYPVGWTEEV